MKFVVKYSEEKDFIPYLFNLWKPSLMTYGGDFFEMARKRFSIEFIESLKKAKTEKDAKKIIVNYWKSIRDKYFEEDTNLLVKWYQRFLDEEKDLIINPLEKVYSEKFPFEEITVYLTTFFSCPYNYENKWFMTYRSSRLISDLIFGSIHELNHFMFYFYWSDYLKKQNISNEKIEYLKESFAVLTSSKPNENAEKPNILPIQNFIKANKDKPIKEIIDLVIKEGLLK